MCRSWFEPAVFLFEPFGFIRSTPVRRITYADALRLVRCTARSTKNMASIWSACEPSHPTTEQLL